MTEQNDSLPVEAVKVWRGEDAVSYILEDLETRAKKDVPIKLSVLATGLSSLMNDPINLFLKGEPSSGKTYNTMQTLQYSSEDNIWFLGGMSPQALVRDHGVLMNKNGEKIDTDARPLKPKRKNFENADDFSKAVENYAEDIKEYRELMKEAYTFIDLSHKLIVFLESPHFETFMMLRPLLSHDKLDIDYKFAAKTQSGDWHTRKVRLHGWPATIFLTTDVKYVEELSTRSFTISPEVNEGKILEANALTNRKLSSPWLYNRPTKASMIISRLFANLREHCQKENLDVIAPFMNLYELFPKEIARDMRDFQHFTQLLKAITLLYYYQRPFMSLHGVKQKLLVCTIKDVERAYGLYQQIFETTRTGMEKRILDFYHNTVKTKDGWYLKELTLEYNKTAKKKLSEERIRSMMARLDEIGYVNTQKGDDPEDKRLNVYRPLMKGEKARTTLNLETWTYSEAKLRKGFEMWKQTILENTEVCVMKDLSSTQWGESAISVDQLQRYVFGESDAADISSIDPTRIRIVGEAEAQAETRIGLETSNKEEIKTDEDTPPKGLIECPECKAQGKPMFFVCDADLQGHVKAWHEGAERI